MKGMMLKYWLAGAIMLAAAAAAVVLKPTIRMAEQRQINLEQMIPTVLGEWQLDSNTIPVQVNPEIQARLTELYSQVLSRTYVNHNGERVMLSLAYGADQSDKYQVHRPEVCYPAQGYPIYGLHKQNLNTTYGTINAQKLFAQRDKGVVEEIDYWILVGDSVAYSGFDRKILQLQYGLKGKVPDGMLVRVSSLSNGESTANRNAMFISELLRAVKDEDRSRLIGY